MMIASPAEAVTAQPAPSRPGSWTPDMSQQPGSRVPGSSQAPGTWSPGSSQQPGSWLPGLLPPGLFNPLPSWPTPALPTTPTPAPSTSGPAKPVPAPTKSTPVTSAPTTPAKPLPTSPAPTTSVPTKPAPTKPAPTTPAPTKPTPSKPVPTTPSPTKSAPTPAPTGSTPAKSAEQTLEAEVSRLINEQRTANGCAALTLDDKLTAAARGHSAWMARTGTLSHTGDGGSTFVTRAKAAGYAQPSAENIAMGYRSTKEVVDGWMNSSGHRTNILNCRSTTAGVGVAFTADGTPYYTQVFGY